MRWRVSLANVAARVARLSKLPGAYAVLAAILVLVLAGAGALRAYPALRTGSASAPSAALASTASPSSPAPASPSVGGGAGAKNIVEVVNQTNDHFRFGGLVQLNRVPGATAAPVNIASAYSSCIDCQTLAVALQLNLVSKTATAFAPQNAATAVNYACTRCVTLARAYQYNIGVDDPTQVPAREDQLVAAMRAEMASIQSSSTSLQDALARVDAVIAQFQDLAAFLDLRTDQTTADTSPKASPPPTASPAPGGSTPAPLAPPASAPPSSPQPTASSPAPMPSPSPT